MKRITEGDLVTVYRAKHPMSRIESIVRFVRNGARSRRRGCVLCGEVGPGWCGNWPRTEASIAWERDHIAAHVEEANN